ncbi:MAG: ABC transporter substrate-binding protein [Sciscionella sp.]
MKNRRYYTIAVVVAASASITLTGCATNNDTGGSPTGAAPTVAKQSDLSALVPKSIRDKGVLTVGIGPNYPPNEYIDSTGKIVGWDVELLNATAQLLGLKTQYVNTTFPQILAGIKTGKYDMGDSSFTDTNAREKTVDFVTYFDAGTQWAGPKGKKIDPNNACGLRVAAQTNTNQLLQDLPARNKKCAAAGKPPIQIQSYAHQADATGAVVLGKADAVLADSPVLAYGVKQSNGKLQLDGPIYGAAPYGWPIAKGSPLGAALKKALASLISDGTYKKILTRWGIEGGAITAPKINDATS